MTTWVGTHRHIKSGGLYRVLGIVKREADWSDEVLYENHKGERMTRPMSEFYDGRFEEVAHPGLTVEAIEAFRVGQKVFVSEMYHSTIDMVCDYARHWADQESKSPLWNQGHGVPCYYCGEPCNGLAADPGVWPVPMSHPEEPGVCKWHHSRCIFVRLHPR